MTSQELQKRANRRISMKDRLMKQIVEARDMDAPQQQYDKVSTFYTID